MKKNNIKPRLIRLTEVLDKTGDTRSGIYFKISKGLFPKPIKLSDRAVAWVESEVDKWIEDMIKASRR